jgi:septal ring factor EnvC (AmiA/AmiB activator)
MDKQARQISWRLLLLVACIAVTATVATFLLGVRGETLTARSDANPSAAAPRATPEQCASDPDSIFCLKARIEELETTNQDQQDRIARLESTISSHEERLGQHEKNDRKSAERLNDAEVAIRNIRSWLRDLSNPNQSRGSTQELDDLKTQIAILKRMIGKQSDRYNSSGKGDFDNVWMAINSLSDRVKRAGY